MKREGEAVGFPFVLQVESIFIRNDQAVVAVLSLVDHAGLLALVVDKDEELVSQKIHLEDSPTTRTPQQLRSGPVAFLGASHAHQHATGAMAEPCSRPRCQPCLGIIKNIKCDGGEVKR